MITIVGPNPAIDHTLDVPGFTSGKVWRSRRSLQMAGGKPINVARTLRRLGVPVTLVCPLGGKHGEPETIAEECDRLGITLMALPISGATRTCVIVADANTGETTVVNEPGPWLSVEEADAYHQLALEHIDGCELILGSGSLTPGLPDDFYGRIAEHARRKGNRFILDTGGPALAQALTARPWALKVNAEEMHAIAGEDSAGAAARFTDLDIEHVVVTRGAEGAEYIGQETRLHIPAVKISVVNPIGAGDAFLAGLAAGLVRGDSWPDALKLASEVAGQSASQFEQDIGSWSPLFISQSGASNHSHEHAD